MIFDAFTIAVMLCSLAPAVLFCVNWRRYVPPPQAGSFDLTAISVLIPARDEQDGIAAAVESVLASTGVAFEVIVMDDGSRPIERLISSRRSRRKMRESDSSALNHYRSVGMASNTRVGPWRMLLSTICSVLLTRM
jgi:cellulose synthase/poly-beta-1,6-N-acetylglucosamine synthase-like glycosyltransferase